VVCQYLIGVPGANTNLQAAVSSMNQNLFLQTIAEVKLSYSTNVRPSDRTKINSSKDAADIFWQVFPGLEHREFFYAMLLNRGNQVLGYYEVSRGGISETVLN